MRKSLAIAALFAASGSAAGAGALNMLGSDTLLNVTTDVLAVCPGASGINYVGTGSSNGEAAMVATANGVTTGTFATGQKIAPMSRFPNSNICTVGSTGVPGPLATATGLVIGIDGIVIATSPGTVSACNSSTHTVNACTNEVGGLAYSTSVAVPQVVVAGTTYAATTYTFQNWKDVLSILYTGWPQLSSAQSSPQLAGCGSVLRQTLANNWGNLFQTSCGTGGAGSTGGSPDGCTVLQHAFRRDDASGTSDAVNTLLGTKPSPNAESNFGFGTTPFCNANAVNIKAATAAKPVVITTSIAHGLSSGTEVQIVGVGENVDGTLYVNGAATAANTGNVDANGIFYACAVTNTTFQLYADSTCSTSPVDGTVGNSASPPTSGGSVGPGYAMVLLPPPPGLGAAATGLADYIPTGYRDLDPVRRPCANNGSPTQPLEDVCGRDNQLGLILPIVATENLNNDASPTQAGQEAQYPGSTGATPATCSAANFAVKTPQLADPIQSGPGNIIYQNAQCPNGDTPHSGNQCPMPVNSTQATQCFNTPSNKPFVFNSHTGLTPSPNQTLGLVYNSRLLTSTKTFQQDVFSNAITGAWYRIHQRDVIAGSGASLAAGANINGGTGNVPVTVSYAFSGTGAYCQLVNPDDQIGCLVQASPCSIGDAAGDGLVWNGTTSNSNNGPLEVNKQFPDQDCLFTFQYPIARKLYLNSIQGWASASTPEQGLAQCEASESTIGAIMTNEHFFDLNLNPSAPTGYTSPFEEDFNETLICPTQAPPASIVNSTTYPVTAPANLPQTGTTCGNGIKEVYEDCDDGTPGATTGAGWPATAVPNGAGFGDGASPTSAQQTTAGTNEFCSNTCRWTNAGFTADTSSGAGCSTAAAGTNCTTSASFTPPNAFGKCQNTVSGFGCLPN